MKQLVQLLSATILLVSPRLANRRLRPPRRRASKFPVGSTVASPFNPASPADNQNFGRFFDDRVNEPLLNQLVINLERALAPQPGQFDWGFKLQFMYGSDARFIHSLGLFSNTAGTSIVQPDLPEAYLNLHFPIITEGGLDLKLGKFVTLEGAETIDPRTNFFYSHTYIFNFGIPFNHTGALAHFSRDQMARRDGGRHARS